MPISNYCGIIVLQNNRRWCFISFVHLHVHTEYSFLDGLSTIQELVTKAKQDGQPAIAITDHGGMAGVIEFYQECTKQGIKPIIGVEAYMCDDVTVKDKDNRKLNHLVLLAKNNTGYRNLLKLVSRSNLEGFYYKPRMDLDMLREHSEGVIALSACRGGVVPSLILEGKLDEATQSALEHNEIFDDYYLELQYDMTPEQEIVNQGLIEISKKTGIPLCVSIDSHYTDKKDAQYHDILLAIQSNEKITEFDKWRFSKDENWNKTTDELLQEYSELTGYDLEEDTRWRFDSSQYWFKTMEEILAHNPPKEALENTLKIAEMCNVTIDFNQDLLPKFPTPEGISDSDYLYNLCYKQLYKLMAQGLIDDPAEYIKRLEYELNVINPKGLASYFLIVWDLYKYAKKRDIMLGPGRGSVGGSLVSHLLGITQLDPIKHGLLFERFLNPDRVGLPDMVFM